MSTMDNACKWNVTEKRGGGELSEAQKNKKCCGGLALWQKIPFVLKFCKSMVFGSGNSTKNHHSTGSENEGKMVWNPSQGQTNAK